MKLSASVITGVYNSAFGTMHASSYREQLSVIITKGWQALFDNCHFLLGQLIIFSIWLPLACIFCYMGQPLYGLFEQKPLSVICLLGYCCPFYQPYSCILATSQYIAVPWPLLTYCCNTVCPV